MRTTVVSLTALALALPCPARANDGAFGGSGASLAPLASTPIRMVREDITLELAGRPLSWRVSAVYEFDNPTATSVVVQMGYPEMRCDPEEGDCVGQGGRFRRLVTRVRGRPVGHRLGRVTDDSPWAMELDRVHLFDVTFAPRERVRIEHRYRYDRSFTAVLGEDVNYLTRTGTLWNGPIGEARFTVLTPDPPWIVEHPRLYRLVSWDRLVRGGRGVTELRFEARNFRPTVDFAVLLGPSARIETGEPVGDRSVDLSECPQGLRQDRSPESRRATREWLAESTLQELTACRNLVLALSGHRFTDERWTRALYGGPERAAQGGDGWTAATMRPATNFSPAQMPAHHAAFLRRLDEELARRPASR